MTIIKSISSMGSFNASSISNGSIASGRMNSFGQSSNATSGIVATLASDLKPAIDGVTQTVNSTLNTVIMTVDGITSGILGI
ncbi:hypothetical protein SAMD00019534_117830 [Acytostelium subglobosum LB1]|uniref:hypothetical protein n=1 Tax=Acytostelium subglobosum LB1 TaxID=1410327 RepID=UPI000644F975|nr:hypothetical protein SAMD00019534_117830 [Acytostelium subglobosum LB1]GAM28607.1 hypothetical protein SAMD00019534_117830 [Acytostelium subglobosum LB1]|eukprot:XP_012748385.1 hypothetical protein SAMD00019534_117830 [Acytostelium subglobosum LB1]